jgi:hypothetical protein
LTTKDASGRLFGLDRRNARIVLGALIALKLWFLFVFAVKSRFVMDEFVQLGWAKYLFHGLFDTVWHAKAVGYVLFYELAHVIGWNAQSILLIGRVQTALLAFATVALVYLCARALGNDRSRALAIVLVLLCFSNFLERIFRTIAEPLAVFFAVAALFAVLRRQRDTGAILAAGALSGLAFLATQKAIYFNVALGLALVGDAALAKRYGEGIRRGALLVLGWTVPIIAYCLLFGGTNPLPIAHNLFFGPTVIAWRGGDEYGGLRGFVLQTLYRNPVFYAFCVAGMLAEAARMFQLDERRRIALIFSIIITALVFAHDQPWPYVFIMALPFMALWAISAYDRLPPKSFVRPVAVLVLATAVVFSFVRNAAYLRVDNGAQLTLVSRAEALLGPDEKYFDGIGMLPNRREPSTLWLDRHYVLKTLREGERSEAYRIFAQDPPKLVLWSRRMYRVKPVVEPLLRDSYVKVAPNIRMAGIRLVLGDQTLFKVPIAGTYALYDAYGKPVKAEVAVNGSVLRAPFHLDRGPTMISLRAGPEKAFLVPDGSYAQGFARGADDPNLFADVYS